MLSGMSEKESKFIQTLWATAGTILAAFVIGSFIFYRAQIVQNATQQQMLEVHEKRIEALESFDKYFPTNGEFHRSVKNLDEKINRNSADLETVKREVREDLKDINSKIDRLIQMQLQK